MLSGNRLNYLIFFQVNDALKRGDHQRAAKNSAIAKWLNVLAIIGGLPLVGFFLYAIVFLT